MSVPQGNPFGSRLFVRKSGRMGATRVPRVEPPSVVVWRKDAATVVIAPNVAKMSPIFDCMSTDRSCTAGYVSRPNG